MPDSSQEHTFRSVLGRTAIRLKTVLEETFQARGYPVTLPQWVLLHALSRQDGVPQKDLARRTFKDQTNVARILAALEDMRYIHRMQDEEDRRYYRVYLTARGSRAEKQLREIATLTLENALRGISEQERRVTLKTLEKVYWNLSRED